MKVYNNSALVKHTCSSVSSSGHHTLKESILVSKCKHFQEAPWPGPGSVRLHDHALAGAVPGEIAVINDVFLESLGSLFWMRFSLPSGLLPPEVGLGLGGGWRNIFDSIDSFHALLLDTQ